MLIRIVSVGVLLVTIAPTNLFAEEPPKIEELDTVVPKLVPKYKLGAQLRNVKVTTGGVATHGAQITEVVKDSAAHKARLEKGDILVAIDGKETKSWAEVVEALDTSTGTVSIKLINSRTGKDRTIDAVLDPNK